MMIKSLDTLFTKSTMFCPLINRRITNLALKIIFFIIKLKIFSSHLILLFYYRILRINQSNNSCHNQSSNCKSIKNETNNNNTYQTKILQKKSRQEASRIKKQIWNNNKNNKTTLKIPWAGAAINSFKRFLANHDGNFFWS